MGDNELLLAISDMMDKKIEGIISCIDICKIDIVTEKVLSIPVNYGKKL